MAAIVGEGNSAGSQRSPVKHSANPRQASPRHGALRQHDCRALGFRGPPSALGPERPKPQSASWADITAPTLLLLFAVCCANSPGGRTGSRHGPPDSHWMMGCLLNPGCLAVSVTRRSEQRSDFRFGARGLVANHDGLCWTEPCRQHLTPPPFPTGFMARSTLPSPSFFNFSYPFHRVRYSLISAPIRQGQGCASGDDCMLYSRPGSDLWPLPLSPFASAFSSRPSFL